MTDNRPGTRQSQTLMLHLSLPGKVDEYNAADVAMGGPGGHTAQDWMRYIGIALGDLALRDKFSNNESFMREADHLAFLANKLYARGLEQGFPKKEGLVLGSFIESWNIVHNEPYDPATDTIYTPPPEAQE